MKKRILALLLTAAMLFSLLPTSALAEDGQKSEASEQTEPIEEVVITEEEAVDEPEPTEEPADEPEPTEEPADEPEPTEEPAEETEDEPAELPEEEPVEEPEDEPGPTEDEPVETEDSDMTEPLLLSGEDGIVASGSCGENLTWTLDSEGVLIISGTGDMEDFPYGLAPWYSYCSSIIDTIIAPGVTSIGHSAFCYCSKLTSISIPESVTSIGGSAFYRCSSLTEVTLPAGVKLGSNVFDGTPWLESQRDEDGFAIANGTLISYNGAAAELTIPEGVTSIGSGAFGNCSNLTSVSIPEGVTSIGDHAFFECYNLTSISIPEGVTSIGSSAFWECFSLTSITIPNSMTNIDDCAFCYCRNLTNVIIPDNVTSIGNNAFRDCYSLTSIYFEGNAPIFGNDWNEGVFGGVTATAYYPANDDTWTEDVRQDYAGNITWEAYEVSEENIVASGSCGENLTWKLNSEGVLIISGTGEMEDYYDNWPWDGSCNAPWSPYRSSIVKAVIESGVTSIGNFSFTYCSGLTSISIPDSVTSISRLAFSDCSGLKDINVSPGSNTYSSIDGVLFDKTMTTLIRCPEGREQTYSIPYGVTSIGESAFSDCGRLVIVTIPDSVTSIGESAFSDCGKLLSITIPDSVTSIGSSAFYKCSRFTSITIPGSVTSIGSGAFDYCENLISVTICYGVTSIGSAFEYCRRLTSISIPESVTSIGGGAFEYCSLTSITIPGSVTSIGRSAFGYCSSLTSIYFEGNAPIFGDDWKQEVFGGVSATAYYPAGDDTWTEEVCGSCGGNITWKACDTSGKCGDKLTWVLDSDGQLGIFGTGTMTDYSSGEAPWYIYKNSISALLIEPGVTSIGSAAFSDCGALEKITFKGNAPTFGNNAFYNVAATAYYPVNNTTWTAELRQGYGGDITWEGCIIIIDSGSCGEKLIWTFDSDGVLTISGTGAMDNYSSGRDVPWYAYSYNNPVLSAVIDSGVTSIGDYAFSGLYSMTSISIPDSVTSIGDYAFSNSGLLSIGIPKGVTSIGKYAFSSSYDLTEIIVAPGNTTYASIDGVLYDKSKTALLCYPGGKAPVYTTPAGVTSIGDGAFSGGSMRSLTISDSVTSIGDSAFARLYQLRSVVFDGNAPIFGDNVFGDYDTEVLYPANDATWTEELRQSCSGDNITWKEYDELLTSGTCGENLTWTLDTEGLLTITGTGEMENYSTYNPYKPYYGEPGWASYNVLRAVIEPGVTSIGDYAFYYSPSLISIDLSDTVTSIGSCSLGGSCGVSEFSVAPGNNSFSSADGVLYNKSKTVLLRYPAGKSQESYTVSDSVTSIGDYAFYGCNKLTEVTLPDNVTSIGDHAFSSCEKLVSIAGLNGVTRIGGDAFYYCESLASITIPDSVKRIGDYAFCHCVNLKNIIFKGDAPTFAYGGNRVGLTTWDHPSTFEGKEGKNTFSEVAATAYYPSNNDTWTEYMRWSYGGDITWVAYDSVKPGDTNGDGDISVKDVVLIMRFIAGDTVELNTDAADVNKDGTVSVKDVVLIMRFIAGDNVTLG